MCESATQISTIEGTLRREVQELGGTKSSSGRLPRATDINNVVSVSVLPKSYITDGLWNTITIGL